MIPTLIVSPEEAVLVASPEEAVLVASPEEAASLPPHPTNNPATIVEASTKLNNFFFIVFPPFRKKLFRFEIQVSRW